MKKQLCLNCRFNKQQRLRYGEKAKPIGKCKCDELELDRKFKAFWKKVFSK